MKWIRWSNLEKNVGLRAKTYGYLIDESSDNKEEKFKKLRHKKNWTWAL